MTTALDLIAKVTQARNVRVSIVAHLARGEQVPIELVKDLKVVRDEIAENVSDDGTQILSFGGKEMIEVSPTYLSQLEKDLIFLESGEPSLPRLYSHLQEIHSGFANEVTAGANLLAGPRYSALFSDRDGTLEVYSPFYATAVQSIYSAYVLSRLRQKGVDRIVLLTSGPLRNPGIVDVNVDAPETVLYAGSKGRQLWTEDGEFVEMELSKEERDILAVLDVELEKLLREPQYRKFGQMGSGFQRKYGEFAIARNTTNPAVVDEKESLDFKSAVENVVARVDRRHQFFEVHDTGSDIEVLLMTSAGSGGFSKGDGIRWINDRMGLAIEDRGPNLVAGDTSSDLAMLKAVSELNPKVRAIFRTSDPNLAQRVRALEPKAVIVTSEDALLWILLRIAEEHYNARGEL